MNYNKIWIPKAIKQKEIIFFHLPFIKKAVTKRELLYFCLGIPLIFPFYYIFIQIIEPKNKMDFIVISLMLLGIPIIISTLSHIKTNQKYLEDIVIGKINHKKNATIFLNKKALNGINKNIKQ